MLDTPRRQEPSDCMRHGYALSAARLLVSLILITAAPATAQGFTPVVCPLCPPLGQPQFVQWDVGMWGPTIANAHPASRPNGGESALECETLPSGEQLRVIIKDSVRAPSGRRPRRRLGLGGQEFNFSLDAMQSWGPGCRMHWVDRS